MSQDQKVKMTRTEFIRKWLGNPDRPYSIPMKDEMWDDLELVANYINQKHQQDGYSINTEKDTLSIDVAIDVADLENLFITAFEGAINYWAIVLDEKIDLSNCEGESSSEKWFDAVWNNLMEMPINDAEDEAVFLGGLTREKMKTGLKKLAEEYPDHYNNFVTGQYDIHTADVWMQLSLLDEIIYG